VFSSSLWRVRDGYGGRAEVDGVGKKCHRHQIARAGDGVSVHVDDAALCEPGGLLPEDGGKTAHAEKRDRAGYLLKDAPPEELRSGRR